MRHPGTEMKEAPGLRVLCAPGEENQSILEALPLPAFAKDRNGIYTNVNSLFETFLGKSRDAIVGKSVTELVPGELGLIYHHQDLDLMASGGLQKYETSVRAANGDLRQVRLDKIAIEGPNGRAAGIIGLVSDITQQAVLEQSLKSQRHDLAQRILETECLLRVARVVSDDALDMGTMINAALDIVAESLYDEALDAPLQFSFNDVVCGPESNSQDDGFLSFSCRADDSERCVLRIPKVLFRDGQEKPGLGPGVLESIATMLCQATRKREVARRLVESEQRFRDSFEQAAVGICHVAPDGRFIRINNRLCDMLGYDAEKMSRLTFQEITVQEDLDHDLDLVGQVIRGEIDNYTLDKRYICGNGEITWGRLTVSLVRKEDGEPNYFISVIQDVTGEKVAQGEVRSMAQQIENLLEGTINVLSSVQELNDPYTAGHQRRVAVLSEAVGQKIGMNESDLRLLKMGAAIHDVGKVGVPSPILSKPSALSDIEFSLVREHSRYGALILEGSELPEMVRMIILQHHERWDGSGYPDGLVGEDISLGARIVAIADTFEAISSHRPYRSARGFEKAIQIVRDGAGTEFDPELVAVFLDTLQSQDDFDTLLESAA
jgi:PAS domain S-box-containing protein